MTVQCNFVCNNLAQSRVAVSSSSYRSIDGNSAIEAGNREKSDRRPWRNSDNDDSEEGFITFCCWRLEIILNNEMRRQTKQRR